MSGDTVPARPEPLESRLGAVGGARRSGARGARGPLAAPGLHRAQPGGVPAPVALGLVLPRHRLGPLGRGRPGACAELANVFARQHDDGFVPHMTYWDQPELHAVFWGRPGRASITQPPMYGHAARRAGPARDTGRRRAGPAGRRRARFLLGPRRARSGAGADRAPVGVGVRRQPPLGRLRGAGPRPGGRGGPQGRAGRVAGDRRPAGSALANPAFEVESAAFNALVAFNARELIDVGLRRLAGRARWTPLVDALGSPMGSRPRRRGRTTPRRDGGGELVRVRRRTLEALLAGARRPTTGPRAASVFDQVLDDAAFGGRCGPARSTGPSPRSTPAAYWRGPAWPQLTYLLWVAARRARSRRRRRLRSPAAMVAGVERSGFAEYWHPDTGRRVRGRPAVVGRAGGGHGAGHRGELTADVGGESARRVIVDEHGRRADGRCRGRWIRTRERATRPSGACGASADSAGRSSGRSVRWRSARPGRRRGRS